MALLQSTGVPAVASYCPAPITTVSPMASYAPVPAQMGAVAMPMMAVTPSYQPAPAPADGAAGFNLPAPVPLTQGLSTPQQLDHETSRYGRALDAQLKKQSDGVIAEAERKKMMFEQAAAQQKAQMNLQIDQQLQFQKLQVDQETQAMLRGLQEAAVQQRTMVEEKAAIQGAEYKRKKAMEDMAQQSYQAQKQWYDREAQLMAEYQKVMQGGYQGIGQANVPTPVAAPVPTAVAPAFAVPTAGVSMPAMTMPAVMGAPAMSTASMNTASYMMLPPAGTVTTSMPPTTSVRVA